VRDEACRIAYEALVNAVRHSGAKRIEIELIFAIRNLKLRVRDNGRGMNSRDVPGKLPEHFGLPGMHETAEQIGAMLEVWSRIGAGTEIALTIPNSVAFESETED
jgi:signal transduction histidine kinase